MPLVYSAPSTRTLTQTSRSDVGRVDRRRARVKAVVLQLGRWFLDTSRLVNVSSLGAVVRTKGLRLLASKGVGQGLLRWVS
ncbi:hypothetical protein KCV07_g75, partial [Aureobasidium melanogenum]